MICTPMARLAIHLDRNSEIMDPPMPNSRAMTRMPPLEPWSSPSSFRTTNRTAMMAKLVAAKSRTRSMGGFSRVERDLGRPKMPGREIRFNPAQLNGGEARLGIPPPTFPRSMPALAPEGLASSPVHSHRPSPCP